MTTDHVVALLRARSDLDAEQLMAARDFESAVREAASGNCALTAEEREGCYHDIRRHLCYQDRSDIDENTDDQTLARRTIDAWNEWYDANM